MDFSFKAATKMGKSKLRLGDHPMGQATALLRYGSLSLFLNEREQRKRRY
jgi:hypothetical protein